MMIEQTDTSDLAIPPGEYLTEVLNELTISQAELGRRIGHSSQSVGKIITGEKAITPEIANQLAQVVDVPAQMWNALETQYRLTLNRRQLA